MRKESSNGILLQGQKNKIGRRGRGVSRFFIFYFLLMSGFSIDTSAQNADYPTKSGIDSGFAARLYLSTSDDPLAIIKGKTITRLRELMNVDLKTNNKLKSAIVSPVDSIYYYYWDVLINDWNAQPYMKGINTYNNQQQKYLYEEKNWDTLSLNWINSIKISYSYNISNNLDSQIGYWWDTEVNEWIIDSKISYKYDSINRLIEQTWQYYDAENQEWINDQLLVIEFPYNDVEVNTNKIWNYINNSWLNSFQTIQEFNNKGFIINFDELQWNVKLNRWDSLRNTIYSYNINDSLENILQSNWDTASKVWVNYLQTSYEYSNLYKSKYFMSKWNRITQTWENYNQGVYTYDDDNNLENLTVLFWNSTTWENNYRYLYSHNILGFLTEKKLEIWEKTDNSWINSWKYNYEYSYDKYLCELSYLNWGKEINAWKSGNKIHYYQEIIINTLSSLYEKPIKAYPNPFTDNITIKSHTGLQSVSISDISGKILFQKVLDNKLEIRFNLNGLAPGFYLVNAKLRNGIVYIDILIRK